MNSSQASSHRRATPAQARSAATVESILAASSALLIDQGLPGFNTNAVAKLAGVNVATLYHYFPHKNAILRELFDRDERARADFIYAQLEDLAVTPDLHGWLHRMSVTLLEMRQGQKAGVALRRACRAVPELMEAEEELNTGLASAFAGVLRRRIPQLPAARAEVAGRAMVEVASTLLDFAQSRPESARPMAEMLETIMRGFWSELERP